MNTQQTTTQQITTQQTTAQQTTAQQKPHIIVFVHLQKCTGTYLDKLFHSIYRKRIKTLTHKPLSTVQKHANKALVVGNIRNPYDVYVSLWAFGCKKKGQLYGTFKNSKFLSQHLAVYSDPSSPQNFRTWLKIILDSETLTKLLPQPKLGFHDSKIMKQFNIGLLTYRFFALYNESNFNLLHPENINKNPVVDIFIRTEHMQEDLAKLNIQIPRTTTQSTKINASKHKSSDFYLDEETKNLIYEKDKYIFTKFGYDK